MADDDENERPQFARASAVAGSAMVDLRADTPRTIVNVIDAVSMARDISRAALVNEILGEWAQKMVHQASLVARIAGINPAAADTGRTQEGARRV